MQGVSWSSFPSEIRNLIYDNVLLEQLPLPMVKQACNYIEGYYKRSSKTDYRFQGVVVNPSVFQKRVPKFPAPELLDELKSCRRSRSSHRAVLSLASTCRQTRKELTPLFYQRANFQIFEEDFAFGYYEDNPFAALRSFLRSIGPFNANSLRRVQVWHTIGKCAFPAPSSLALIHGLDAGCIVRLPSADTMNRLQRERAMKLSGNQWPSITCFCRGTKWMEYTQKSNGLTPKFPKRRLVGGRWRQRIHDWILDPRPSRPGVLLSMKAWAENQEKPEDVPTLQKFHRYNPDPIQAKKAYLYRVILSYCAVIVLRIFSSLRPLDVSHQIAKRLPTHLNSRRMEKLVDRTLLSLFLMMYMFLLGLAGTSMIDVITEEAAADLTKNQTAERLLFSLKLRCSISAAPVGFSVTIKPDQLSNNEPVAITKPLEHPGEAQNRDPRLSGARYHPRSASYPFRHHATTDLHPQASPIP
ncbi:hypothetical protein BLS_003794 [Venturia inaequalis]|uniref:F-box domain-containing protein n=1 Tax=Venturia inaequalis TaxID=5025 RepID=A0A8H3YXX2_VENIN|nr:hypothetical protein BLS_003794 [Venturia inaequalis]